MSSYLLDAAVCLLLTPILAFLSKPEQEGSVAEQ